MLLIVGPLKNGAPTEVKGRYYLNNHGTYSRELTREEYARYQAYEVREFSGVWMVFSYLPFIYFAFLDKKLWALPSSDGQSAKELNT